MRERIPTRASTAVRESVDQKKQRLGQLLEQANVFCDLDQEMSARIVVKLEPDETQRAQCARMLDEFKAQLPFIASALNDRALQHEALQVCHALMPTMLLGRRIAKCIADSAMVVKDHIEQYPSNVGQLLHLMKEAHDELSRHPEYAKEVAKIRHSLNVAGPSLEILFSDASPPHANNVVNRIFLLAELHVMMNEKNREWIRKSIGDHIILCVDHNLYLPDISMQNALEFLPPDKEDVFKLTRQVVEITLGSLEKGEHVRDVLNRVLTYYGLPKDLHKELDTEAETAGNPFFNQCLARMLDQLEYIQELEKLDTGATEKLFKQFGIRWLSRYPKWLLAEQYKTRDEKVPYGILFGASHDWNNASFEENDRGVVESLASQLKAQGIALRIIEAASKEEMQTRFSALSQSYGEHTARFLFIRSHGDRQGITLGVAGDEGVLLSKDLEGVLLRSLRQPLSERAPIILDGCSVGRRGGFAETASAVFDTKVIAPPGVTSALNKITVMTDGDKMDLQVYYESEKKYQIRPSHVYISGRKR